MGCDIHLYFEKKVRGYEPHFACFIKKYFPLDTNNDKKIRIIMGFDN